jgi:hypothetical protein
MGEKGLDGLELDDEPIGNQDVEAALADLVTFVGDGYGNLAEVWNASRSELDAKGMLVDRFEEARSENTMDFDRSLDDAGGVPIDCWIWFIVVPWRSRRPGASSLRTSAARSKSCVLTLLRQVCR